MNSVFGLFESVGGKIRRFEKSSYSLNATLAQNIIIPVCYGLQLAYNQDMFANSISMWFLNK